MTKGIDISKGATVYAGKCRRAFFISSVVDRKELIIERARAIVANDKLFVPISQNRYVYRRYDQPRFVRIRFAYSSWWVMDDRRRDYKITIAFGYMDEYYEF